MNVPGSARIAGLLPALALVLASAAIPASAHHSAAPFDMSKQISLRGTVERWHWANPHSWLYIKVATANGTTSIWGLEAGSTNALVRMGWSARDMRPGDKVTVSVHPARNGNRVGLLSRVELPGGRVLGSGFGSPPPASSNTRPSR